MKDLLILLEISLPKINIKITLILHQKAISMTLIHLQIKEEIQNQSRNILQDLSQNKVSD